MRLLHIFITLTVFLTCWAGKPFVVVIDAGHGGKDIGCRGDFANEKAITLDVAQQLGRMIGESYPEDIKVVYTRNDDRFVSLQDRANIANRSNGDFFISIHVNSIDRKTRGREKVHGASVYTLGLDKSENNLSVAMRENAVIELEEDYDEKYQGFDPSSSESYIIFELNQNSHLKNSISMATEMQQRLVAEAGRADKGVRQAGFWVLWATGMPSVLVELDFICNAAAEKFLASEQGRQKCAEALYNAFVAYYKHRGGKVPTKPLAQPKTDNEGKVSSTAESITYHVQFTTSPRQLKSTDAALKKIPQGEQVGFYKDGSTYKYYFGNYTNTSQAQKAANSVQKQYPGAFVIKMSGGKRQR